VSAPAVTVVVPTHGRPERLRRLLDALAEQTVECEVVVGHDGTSAATTDVIAGHPLAAAGRLRAVTVAPGSGPAPKRNAGWRAGSGSLVAFTDDDCRPAPDWLAAGLEAHEYAPEAVIQGRTVPDPDDAGLAGPFSRTISVDRLGPWFETCNVFYPRELLERLDGFDEGYGSELGGEEIGRAHV